MKGEIKMTALNIEMGIIRQGFEREDLLTYIDRIDQDASGANGEDYLLDRAREAGYESNAEMWVDVATSLYRDTETIVSCVMTSLISTWMSCCRYHDFKTLKTSEGNVVVTFVNAD